MPNTIKFPLINEFFVVFLYDWAIIDRPYKLLHHFNDDNDNDDVGIERIERNEIISTSWIFFNVSVSE